MSSSEEQNTNALIEELVPEDSIVPLTLKESETGLTAEEVKQRVSQGLVNITQKKGQRTVKQIVLSHTITYFNILNVALALLVLFTGHFKNILFIGTVISNAVIGIIQELKVKQLIDKLSVVTVSRSKVLRDGLQKIIPVDQLVTDDIAVIEIGNQIATDGTVLCSSGLELNESMLTGESKPVKKKAGDPILSGSFVVAGTGAMKVEKVGNDCYASQLVFKAQSKKRASSEMQAAINRVIKVVSVAIIPIGILLYRSQISVPGATLSTAVVGTVSGIIGMIPEGLVLLTSVSFILGVGRLATKNALVQEMESIEALARVDIICTDKTGTITTGDLHVEQLIPFGSFTKQDITDIIAHMNGAFTDSNVTQIAVDSKFGKKTDWTVEGTVPFSSDRKYKAASFAGHGSFVIGAPEYLIPGKSKILQAIESYSARGYRVLLLGKTEELAEEAGVNVTPLAVLLIADVIKEDAKTTFKYFADNKVAIKVLSGDNPVTVSAVAQNAGVEGAEHYVDASTLPDDPKLLAEEIKKYSVFGRVKPEQKQAFVRAWQAGGNTVAMVGDGVNDVLAIKDADCGIAMAAGSDAAKQAAHIVLLNSNFASMTDIVAEGRTIIANIERVSSLYLTKTIYSSILCVIFIFLNARYPWTTLQMGLINVCAIGMPSFLLTLEQHKNAVSDGFLKNVLRVCVPAALTMVIDILLLQVLKRLFNWNEDLASTFNLAMGCLVGLLVVIQVSWPLTLWRKIVLGASAFVFIAGMIVFPGLYDIHNIWTPWMLLIIPLTLITLVIIAYLADAAKKFMIWFYWRRRPRASGK